MSDRLPKGPRRPHKPDPPRRGQRVLIEPGQTCAGCRRQIDEPTGVECDTRHYGKRRTFHEACIARLVEREGSDHAT